MSTEEEQQGRKKGGRPRKAVCRSTALAIRLTPAERIVIAQKAAAAGQPVAEWVRRAARNAVILLRLSTEEMALLRSLAGLGNNLNQLTKLAHREGLLSLSISLRELLENIRSFMDKLQRDGGKTD